VKRQDRRARSLLRRLTPGARADLLRVLTSPESVRADVIRQFWERPGGRDMADVLMDLEADDLIRLAVIEELRRAQEAESR
jgi:hypothetical protein